MAWLETCGQEKTFHLLKIKMEENKMKFFISILLFCIMNSIGWAKSGSFKYKGYDAQYIRGSTLEFTIKSDGTVSGIQKISKVCKSNAHLAGGKITFTGYTTGAYPQVTGKFNGIVYYCGGKTSKTSGTFKMGYHPQFGVFIQLFNSINGEEYYHKQPNNNPFK